METGCACLACCCSRKMYAVPSPSFFVLDRMFELIEPFGMTVIENELFGVSGDMLGLLTLRIVHLKDQEPIEYCKSAIRGDKGRFAIEHRFHP